jgi:hypothetical protein
LFDSPSERYDRAGLAANVTPGKAAMRLFGGCVALDFDYCSGNSSK